MWVGSVRPHNRPPERLQKAHNAFTGLSTQTSDRGDPPPPHPASRTGTSFLTHPPRPVAGPPSSRPSPRLGAAPAAAPVFGLLPRPWRSSRLVIAAGTTIYTSQERGGGGGGGGGKLSVRCAKGPT